jgi:hypothetical protein
VEYNAKTFLAREDWRNKSFNLIEEVPDLVVTDDGGDDIYHVWNFKEEAELAQKRELDRYELGSF